MLETLDCTRNNKDIKKYLKNKTALETKNKLLCFERSPQWVRYLTFIFDIYISTFTFDIYMWQLHLTCIFDIYICHLYLTITFDISI